MTEQSTAAAPTRQQMEAMIVKRAWTDDAFKAEFLADPKATIEKYAEQSLPATLAIHAHAEDETTVHIVIPAKPADSGELSEDDLEKVAGGIDVATVGIIAGIISVAAAGVTAASIGASIAGEQTARRHGW